MSEHILYSYRRCPYAMRARMALVAAGIQCKVHEIDFKNKPQAMLDISPKGTVPVFHTAEGSVIDESLDIMRWALGQNDPDNWMNVDNFSLIDENDGEFKSSLDRYKYPNRFPDEDCSKVREKGLEFLKKLNTLLKGNGQLNGSDVSIIDIAIFPFIRQFSNVDKAWFDKQDIPELKKWLLGHLDSSLFEQIMRKRVNSEYDLID